MNLKDFFLKNGYYSPINLFPSGGFQKEFNTFFFKEFFLSSHKIFHTIHLTAIVYGPVITRLFTGKKKYST